VPAVPPPTNDTAEILSEAQNGGTAPSQNYKISKFFPPLAYCLRYYDYHRPSIMLIDYIVPIVPIQWLLYEIKSFVVVSSQLSSAFHSPGVGKSSTSLYGWG